MARVVGFLLLMALAALVAYWLLAPRLLHTAAAPPTASRPSIPNTASLPATVNGNAQTTTQPPNIPPPLSAEQQSDIARENQRAPYYDWLRNASNGFVQQAYADTDRTVLIVQLATTDAQALSVLFEKAIVPYAHQYGFLHVRFYVPASQSNPVDRQLYAEAACTNNAWQLFFR